MRKTKELLLAGTMIPVLIGAGPGFAASPPAQTPWLMMAQAEPGGPAGEERKHPAPGGPGAAPHQAPEGRPAAPPRAAEPPAPRQPAPEAPRPAPPKPEAPARQAPPPAPRAAEPEPAAPRAAPKPAAPQPRAEEAPAARQPAPRAAEPEAPARAAPKAAAPETPEPRPAAKPAAPAPAAPKAAEPETAPQRPAPKAAEPEAAPAQRPAPKAAAPQAAPAKPEPAQPNSAAQPRPNAEPRNAAPPAPANEAPVRAGAPRPAAEPNGAAPGTQPPAAAPNRMENLRQTAPNQAAPGQPAPVQPTPAQPAPGQPAPAQRAAPAPATNAAPAPAPVVAPAKPGASPEVPAAVAPAPANTRPAAPPPAPPPPPPPPPPAAAPQAAPGQAQAPGQPAARRKGDRGGDNASGAIVGAAAGFVGGFLAAQAVQNFNQVQADRQVFTDDGVNIIREPGRTIVEQDDRYFIAHDENERFRDLGYNLDVRRADGYEVTSYATRDGSSVYTYTDAQGRLVRRVREYPDGRSVILIDNRYDRYDRNFVEDVVTLPPPPPADLPPPDRYIVDAADAPPTLVYDTLSAPPVAPLPRRYTLDQIRYSPDIRARMRSVDLNTITFATGSWTVSPDQAPKLASIASAINAAIRQNPKEIYMVEGYTDATGNPADNLSLSDRRAQSVATILTRDFQVPPENLVTQGYGAQFLKVQTQGPSVENRRVAVRRITPLLNQSANGQ